MNRAKMYLIGGCLVAAMIPQTSSAGVATSFVTKDALSDGSYCHMKFPAIVEETLRTAQPVLKDVSEGDIIDFYGSCGHDPLGKDEVHSQLLHLQHRRARDYMD
jgi:hypothetical protein